MRWGLKLPDCLLFNARSEGIESSKFWKDLFEEWCCIVPADSVFEWQQPDKGKKKPKYEIVIPGQEQFAEEDLVNIIV
jgi:putative SOS response-associated peptidase YedK